MIQKLSTLTEVFGVIKFVKNATKAANLALSTAGQEFYGLSERKIVRNNVLVIQCDSLAVC